MARGRVLVADADPSVTAPIRAVLEEEGYAVREAGSTTHALTGAEECDLAIVSLTLPESSGVGCVRALLSRRPGLPVVVTIPEELSAQGLAARAVGAYAFLESPHDLTREKILTIVANALERQSLLAQLAAAREVLPDTLNLEDRERHAIMRALATTGWNKQAAARLLGLHRPTLYAKMRKHGIPQKRPG